MPDQPEPKQPVVPQPDVAFETSEEFWEDYANNVQFETSVWDLKFVFGKVQQPKDRDAFIEQYAAMRLPWPQVKLLHYYLAAQLAAHEAINGRITVPPAVLPVDPHVFFKDADTNPLQRQIVDAIGPVWERFMKELADPLGLFP